MAESIYERATHLGGVEATSYVHRGGGTVGMNAPVHERLLQDGLVHLQQQHVVVLEIGAVRQPRALALG